MIKDGANNHRENIAVPAGDQRAENADLKPWQIDGKDWLQHSCCWDAPITTFRDGKKVLVAEADRDDAALIVRAVNCHAEMLAALKAIQEWLMFPKELTKEEAGLWNAEFVKANNLTVAVIAKATTP